MENPENWSDRLIIVTHHELARGRGSRLMLSGGWNKVFLNDLNDNCYNSYSFALKLPSHPDSISVTFSFRQLSYYSSVKPLYKPPDSIMSEINVTAVLHPRPEKFDEVGRTYTHLSVPI